MALTDFCDVLGSVSEDGFNRIFFHIMSQRPSLFCYGTRAFVKNPELLCCPPENVHPEVIKRGNPIVSQVPFLSIPGYSGGIGLEYNFSLKDLRLDLEPGNQFRLPPELGDTVPQQALALHAVICGGIACPPKDVLEQFIIYPEPYRPNRIRERDVDDREGRPLPAPERGLPFNRESLNCFKLDLFGVFRCVREDYLGEPVLALKLQNIEIVDITPDGLENSIECFIRTTLILGILPKLRIAMKSLVFNIQDFIVIQPTAISASVPFNPSIAFDQLTVRLTLTTP
jgi:hypothetical protein